MSLSKGAKRSPRRILLLYCKPISEPSCRDLNIKQRLLAAWSSIADPVDTITKCDQLLTTAGQSSTAFRNAVLQTQARCTGLAEDKLIALYARQQYVELIRPGALLKSKYAQDKVQSPKRAHVLFALGLAQNKLHKNMEAQTTLAASAAMFSQCNQIADAVRVALMAAHCAEESGDRTTSLKRYNDASLRVFQWLAARAYLSFPENPLWRGPRSACSGVVTVPLPAGCLPPRYRPSS